MIADHNKTLETDCISKHLSFKYIQLMFIDLNVMFKWKYQLQSFGEKSKVNMMKSKNDFNPFTSISTLLLSHSLLHIRSLFHSAKDITSAMHKLMRTHASYLLLSSSFPKLPLFFSFYSSVFSGSYSTVV